MGAEPPPLAIPEWEEEENIISPGMREEDFHPPASPIHVTGLFPASPGRGSFSLGGYRKRRTHKSRRRYRRITAKS